MSSHEVSAADKTELFSHQQDDCLFSALAVETAGLNYLDQLNRKQRDPLSPSEERTAALHKLIDLEHKLFHYIIKQTPISYFNADFREQTAMYITMRNIFLKADAFTFKRHRLRFLLDLLRLYGDDPCRILPERDMMKEKLECKLLHEYLLLDMGQKNTEDIGREAVSNGYHECDYTLEIEEVWKHPMKAVPRTNFNYVLQSLSCSRAAVCTAAYIKAHKKEMIQSQWVVDADAIQASCSGAPPAVTPADIAAIRAMYIFS